MATVTFDNGAVWDNTQSTDKYTTKIPGHGGKSNRPVVLVGGDLRGLQTSGLPLQVVTGTFSFDTSYPSGGEDISGIWDMFTRGLAGITFDCPNTATVRYVVVDTGNKKLKAYVDGASQTEATGNLSTVTGVRFMAWGY